CGNGVINFLSFSSNTLTANGSPAFINALLFLIHLYNHSRSRLSATPRRAGPVDLPSSLWQAAHCELDKAFPAAASPAAAASATCSAPAASVAAASVAVSVPAAS